MKLSILDRIQLKNIPSGSGIIKHANGYYIVGDDSPYLYSLDHEFEFISKTLLLEEINFEENGRILKSEKPDFEAIEMIGNDEVIIFGSGSKSPQRDVFVRVFLNDSLRVEKYNISSFYNHLRNLPIFSDSELNIEALAFHNDNVLLFNRRKNLIIQFQYASFLEHLNDNSMIPQMLLKQYTLPSINDVEAGFSGATTLMNETKIIFTASVENTDNAYDDGEILGSFVGVIDIVQNQFPDTFECIQLPNEGEVLKIESICIDEEISSGKTQLTLISDDDKGNSEIVKCMIGY